MKGGGDLKRISLIQIISVLILAFAAFGYFFAPNDPQHIDLGVRLAPKNHVYPLGADTMGRCILSRLLYGGKTTMWIVGMEFVLVFLCGTGIGLFLAGFAKRFILAESTLSALTAIPPLVYLIVFMGAWGNSMATMIVALTLSLSLRLIKLVKFRALEESKRAYVLCAYVSGENKALILVKEILPNIFYEVLRFLCLSSVEIIISISAFSIIGLSMGAHVVDWGLMISDARSMIITRPDLILYPVGAIVACSFALNSLARSLEGG